MINHLSSTELVTALDHDAALSPSTAAHLAQCAVCRVRLTRLRHGAYTDPAGARPLAQDRDEPLVSTQLLGVAATPSDGGRPAAGELWRAGRDEAALVWVRDTIGTDSVEVVPVVLDLAMADDSSISIPAGSTVLGVEAAAIVSMRCHLHVGSFINRLDQIDLETEVAQVVTKARSGDLVSHGLRFRADAGWDYPDEDRDDLEELLAALNPAVWDMYDPVEESATTSADTIDYGPHRPHELSQPQSLGPGSAREAAFAAFAADLDHRLWGVRCRHVSGTSHRTDVMGVESFLKASYLDTTVLVVIATTMQPADEDLAVEAVVEAVEPFTRLEQDIDAIVASVPHREWQSVLITRAHMRPAVQLPAGDVTGPTFTISGFGLIDTLVKHFDGSAVAWEVLDDSITRMHGANVHDTALRHATESAVRVRAEGRRARTPGKILGWQLDYAVDADVARFIAAVAADTDIDDALAELGLEDR